MIVILICLLDYNSANILLNYISIALFGIKIDNGIWFLNLNVIEFSPRLYLRLIL